MKKVNTDHNRTSFENQINKNLYRFLVREFYQKEMDLMEMISLMSDLFFFKVSDSIKEYYFSVSLENILFF